MELPYEAETDCILAGNNNDELILQMAILLACLEISHSKLRLLFLELEKLPAISRNEQKRV
jgi:hypothetical protein